MHTLRVVGVAIAITALTLLASSSAFAAYSSTVSPHGDSVSASSVPITLTSQLAISDSCTLNGGVFAIPSKLNHNSSGSVTMSYTTRPTYTSCSGNTSVAITTSGTWTVAAQYGQAATTITVPTNGLTLVWGTGNCTESNTTGPVSFTGNWNNGFSEAGLNASSAITYSGSALLHQVGSCGGGLTWTFGLGLQTLTDTTEPTLLPVLGP